MDNNEVRTNSDILSRQVREILTADQFLKSLQIDAVSPVSGGVAHQVWCIEAEGKKFFLKIRGDHFAAIPEITSNPSDIRYEYQALQIFGKAAPEHFPEVLSFNDERHYLILSDVIQEGNKLEDVLQKGEHPDRLFELYGRTLATIHTKISAISEPIRPDGDETHYATILGHRFGYRNHPILNAAVVKLSGLPKRQLILGDPAPKNMGIRNNNQWLTFFDLETAHRGNIEFDYAYGLAHSILHTISNREHLRETMKQFIRGYGQTDFDTQLIYQLTLGIILYRLHSVIPYPLALSDKERNKVESNVSQMLFSISGRESYEEIAYQLATI